VPASCGGFFDVEKLQKDLATIEGRMAASDFWSNRERAQADVEEVSRLRLPQVLHPDCLDECMQLFERPQIGVLERTEQPLPIALSR
jgi:hypothetical protein